jgi:hypothetical protein
MTCSGQRSAWELEITHCYLSSVEWSVTDFLNKLPQTLTTGLREQLLRWTFFFNTSLVQKNRLGLNMACKAHFMGDNQHGAPLFGE